MGELVRPTPSNHKRWYYELVWTLVQLIPIGYVATYKALSELLGIHPRSVAAALKANPRPIVIPCHRVVSTTGLGGYSFGGISVKRKLLEIEDALDQRGKPKRVINSGEELLKIASKSKPILEISLN